MKHYLSVDCSLGFMAEKLGTNTLFYLKQLINIEENHMQLILMNCELMLL